MGKFEMESDEDVSIDKKDGVVYPSDYQERKMISVNDIMFDTTQSRHGEWENDDLDLQLMGSVEEIGLIYRIIVRPTDSIKYGGNPDKPYVCVAGSRRFHSMIASGHTEVPCVVRDFSDIEAVEISLSENIGRKELSPFQEQRAINLWFNMLHEKKTQEFMENNKVDNVEDMKDGNKRSIRASIIQEIANKIYGKSIDRVYEILRIGALDDKVKILLKKVSERTPEEIEYIKSQGISNDFVMNKRGLVIIREIEKKYFSDFALMAKTQKIFEMIKKGKIDKESGSKWQIYILKDIRDKLKTGKSFEVVMEELETKEKEYEVEEGTQRYVVRILPNYIKWHERACSELRKSSSEVISYIYFEWLKNKAKENDW